MRPLRLLSLLVIVASLAACGASARERTINTTLAAVNEARTAFVVFDRGAQAAIVATSTSFEQGDTALRAYRAKREIVVDSFSFAYKAIATAATLKDARSLSDMITAVAGVLDAVRDFRERASP